MAGLAGVQPLTSSLASSEIDRADGGVLGEYSAYLYRIECTARRRLAAIVRPNDEARIITNVLRQAKGTRKLIEDWVNVRSEVADGEIRKQ